MAEGLGIDYDGWRTRLKWHRGHKQLGDISFTRARIAEGLALGASVEIDLLRHGDDGFVVLHDAVLDDATTGHGPVCDATIATLRSLHLRGADGQPSAHGVMLLEDLAALIAATQIGAGGILQVDFKDNATALNKKSLQNFVAVIAPVRQYITLSAGNRAALSKLLDALPGLSVGYDPCHYGAIERVLVSCDFAGFVSGTIEAMPQASMIYLEHTFVLGVHQMGFDLVGAFHAEGRQVDAYTIKQADATVIRDVSQLLALKCDQITTDDPIGLETLLSEAIGRIPFLDDID